MKIYKIKRASLIILFLKQFDLKAADICRFLMHDHRFDFCFVFISTYFLFFFLSFYQLRNISMIFFEKKKNLFVNQFEITNQNHHFFLKSTCVLCIPMYTDDFHPLKKSFGFSFNSFTHRIHQY